MMDIATWAREYFGKSLSVNTVCRCIKKYNLKLQYAEEGIYKFCAETLPSSQGTKSSEMDQKTVEMSSLVRHVHILACFWEHRILPCQRWTRPSRLLLCKNQPLWWYRGATVPTAWVICIHVKVTLMRRLMLEFWRDICCRQDDDFSQELHVYFSRTMPGLILHKLQQCSFVGIECVCLTGLSAVQICLLLKMYGASWRGESDNANHGLLSSSRLVYTNNATCKTTTDIFNSQTITKCNSNKKMLPSRKHACPTFFLSVLQASISKFVHI